VDDRDARRVLIADDEANLRRVLSAQLARDGYEVATVDDGQAAIEALAFAGGRPGGGFDVLITDLRMPKVDGMALLRHVSAHHPEVPVIIITAHGTVDTAVEALKMGAFDYVTKPFDQTEIRRVVGKAARTRELSEERLGGGLPLVPEAPVADPEDSPGRFRLIGRSPAMEGVYAVLEKVADTPSTVLVTGESGTGKELIARALHESSSRRDAPFIRVNCAAIPTDLLESELFGYEKGAFTGAVTSKPGRFELADGGTLFLDEVGDIPAAMQVKLLRALQEQEFERVGGIKTLSVDVRLVAATNTDLRKGIEEGRFREDLYYRLNVVHLEVPPLRERTDDIPTLVEHFLRRLEARLGKRVEGLSADALAALRAYPWPGNIRELENVIERCVLFAEGPRIERDDLPGEVAGRVAPRLTPARGLPTARAPAAPPEKTPVVALDPRWLDAGVGLKVAVREATSRIEREIIARALDETGGNVTHAARLLKISRKSLQTKMKELHLRND
jgi:nitrogen regulation protein NR(I)